MRSIVTSAAIALVGFALVLGAQAQTQDSEPAPTKDRPLLELDLRKFGYVRDGTFYGLRTFVDFTDTGHLALAWVATDDPAAPKRRSPTHLQIVVLDAVTGNKTSGASYPTPSSAVQFAGMPDGKFLSCARGVLRVHFNNSEVVRERQLLDEHACQGAEISPSRRTFLLSSRASSQDKTKERTLLSLDTFSPIQEWSEDSEWSKKCHVLDISDHWLAARCGRPGSLFIRGLDQDWLPFQPAGEHTGAFGFVNDQTLAIQSENHLAVSTVDGNVLFQVTPSDRRFPAHYVTSTGGTRFAAIEDRMRGLRSEPLDMYPFMSQERVAVYSIQERRAIYVVRVQGTSPWTPWAPHLNHVALSPDGMLLAVVSDHTLRVYSLPERSSKTN